MRDKLESLFDDLQLLCRGKPKEDWDNDVVLELVEKMVDEYFPTTLDNASDWDIVDEVNYRGIEDQFYDEVGIDEYTDGEIMEELDRRNINIPGIQSLYDSVQRGDTKRTLDIIRNLSYNCLGRIVTVNSL